MDTGSYALLIYLHGRQTIKVGALGEVEFKRGGICAAIKSCTGISII